MLLEETAPRFAARWRPGPSAWGEFDAWSRHEGRKPDRRQKPNSWNGGNCFVLRGGRCDGSVRLVVSGFGRPSSCRATGRDADGSERSCAGRGDRSPQGNSRSAPLGGSNPGIAKGRGPAGEIRSPGHPGRLLGRSRPVVHDRRGSSECRASHGPIERRADSVRSVPGEPNRIADRSQRRRPAGYRGSSGRRRSLREDYRHSLTAPSAQPAANLAGVFTLGPKTSGNQRLATSFAHAANPFTPPLSWRTAAARIK
jgi:hypothetical protein